MREESLFASLGGDTTDTTAPIAPTVSNSTLSKEEAFAETSGIHQSTGITGVTSSLEEKAISLLGSGIMAEQVASALGVTPARIAQLLSKEHFSKRVAALRYTNLQSHNVRDSAYDELEDSLLEKLGRAMPLLIKPRDIIDALTKVNAAKRRGHSAPNTINSQQTVVSLILPTVITEKFSIDLNNQVTRAGNQELLTMPSGNLLKQVEKAEEEKALTAPIQTVHLHKKVRLEEITTNDL